MTQPRGMARQPLALLFSGLLVFGAGIVFFGISTPASSAQICPFPTSFGSGPAPSPGPGPGPSPGPSPSPSPSPSPGPTPPPPGTGGTTPPPPPPGTGGTTPPPPPGPYTGPAGGGGGPAGGPYTPVGGTTPGGAPVAGNPAPGGAAPPRATAGGTTPAAPAGSPNRGGPAPSRAKRGGASVATWDYWWNLNKWEHLRLREALRRQAAATTDADQDLDVEAPASESAISPLARTVVRDEVLPALKRALTDRYHPNREAAILALGKSGDASCVFDLLSALKDGDQAVQEAGTLALGLLGRAEAVDHLLGVFGDTSAGRELVGRPGRVNDALRGYAAFSLGLLKDLRASAPLLAAVKTASASSTGSASTEVAVFAAAGLGLLGDHGVIPDLCRIVADPARDATLRGACSVALGKLGDRSPSIVKVLEAALAARQAEVVQGAASALGQLARPSDESAVDALVHTVEKGEDVLARAFALMSLGRIGGQKSLEATISQLKKNGTLAGYAPIAAALAAKGTERSAEVRRELRRVHQDGDTQVRGSCLLAFGLMGATGEIPLLLKAATDEKNLSERTAAVAALGLLGAVEARPVFEQILATGGPQDAELRHEAAIGLGLIGRRGEAVSRLLKALGDGGSTYLRAGCALALGLVGGREAVPGLRDLAIGVDVNPEARCFASGALGLLAESADIPVLYQFRANNLYYLDLPAMRKLLLLL